MNQKGGKFKCYNFGKRYPMTILSLEDKHTKDLMKQALLELFEERRDLFYELFEELFEDVCLANAMREGENGEIVSEKEVMKALGA